MDWKELERYRPIPWGGVKFFLGLVATLVLTANGALIALFMHKWIPDLPGDLEIAPGVFLGMSIMLGVWIYAVTGSRREWLENYWRRNVKGHNAWFWCDDKGKVQWGISRLAEERILALCLPLGGWFRKGRIDRGVFDSIGMCDSISRSWFKRWQVKLTTLNQWRVSVELRDPEGGRACLDVEVALELGQAVRWCGGNKEATVSSAIELLLADRQKVHSERDETKLKVLALRGELASAESELGNALAVIDKAIVAIKNTSRLGKSKEAQRIREGLVNGLVHSAPMGHPLRERYEQPDSQPAAAAP